MTEPKKPASSVSGEDDLPAIDFSTFILSLSHSAFVHLGDAPPLDGHKPERNLSARHARPSISSPSCRRRRATTSLAKRSGLLDQALYDLRLRFVEVSKTT